jgi:hypothetical protein
MLKPFVEKACPKWLQARVSTTALQSTRMRSNQVGHEREGGRGSSVRSGYNHVWVWLMCSLPECGLTELDTNVKGVAVLLRVGTSTTALS